MALSGVGLGSVQGKNDFQREHPNKDIEYLNIEEVAQLNEKLNDANLFSRTSEYEQSMDMRNRSSTD